jgi:hypothetical protein
MRNDFSNEYDIDFFKMKLFILKKIVFESFL